MRLLRSVYILSVAAFTACAPTPEQNEVIAKANSLKPYPVRRTSLIKTFGLESIESEQVNGGVRSRHAWFQESWAHPSGLTITAIDSEYVGNETIQKRSIDAILNDPERFPRKHSPRHSFKQLLISNPRGKVVFNSTATN
jgi:hypothetical protein